MLLFIPATFSSGLVGAPYFSLFAVDLNRVHGNFSVSTTKGSGNNQIHL